MATGTIKYTPKQLWAYRIQYSGASGTSVGAHSFKDINSNIDLTDKLVDGVVVGFVSWTGSVQMICTNMWPSSTNKLNLTIYNAGTSSANIGSMLICLFGEK